MTPTPRFARPRPLARLAPLLALALVGCGPFDLLPGEGRSRSESDAPPPPPVAPPTLGDIGAESDFVDTLGYGTITILEDDTLDGIPAMHADLGNGFFLIRTNPRLLALLPEPVRDHLLYRQFGHLYLQHDDEALDQRRDAHEADAFGIRQVRWREGPLAAGEAIDWFQGSGIPQDLTHPSHAARALYLQDVDQTFSNGNATVPEPPPTVGFLTVINPFGVRASVWVGGVYVGWLDPLEFDEGPLLGDPIFGDSYEVQLADFTTNSLLLDGLATIYAPGTTSWPGLGLDGPGDGPGDGPDGGAELGRLTPPREWRTPPAQVDASSGLFALEPTGVPPLVAKPHSGWAARGEGDRARAR